MKPTEIRRAVQDAREIAMCNAEYGEEPPIHLTLDEALAVEKYLRQLEEILRSIEVWGAA
jgi:hypothetical protein